MTPNPARMGTVERSAFAQAAANGEQPSVICLSPTCPRSLRTLGDSIEDRAGRFVILTAVRRKEALAATWGEFDLKARVWTVPAARMKVKDHGDHKVPLSARGHSRARQGR